MCVTNEIEDLRHKLNSLIIAKEIITNDSEILNLSVELDKKINTFMFKKIEDK